MQSLTAGNPATLAGETDTGADQEGRTLATAHYWTEGTGQADVIRLLAENSAQSTVCRKRMTESSASPLTGALGRA